MGITSRHRGIARSKPQAELWLGAHPGSPSRIVHPEKVGGASDLARWIAADPATALGDAPTLPFLMKVLAADSALSIQAHPSMAQAIAGFARENAAGIPVDAPDRNYRDASHKPELIFCLSDTFDALCGMRSPTQVSAVLRAFMNEGVKLGLSTDELDTLIAVVDANERDVRDVVELLLEPRSDRARRIVAQLVAIANGVAPESPIALDSSTVRLLATEYPNDPGIAVALLMNRVQLRRGEALFVTHGVLHAYLSGLGIEIMSASDNVLRGGLTSKHIDVPELMSVGVFAPSSPVILPPITQAPGVESYAPGVPEFDLLHVRVGDGIPHTRVATHGPCIAICTAGHAQLTGRDESMSVSRGVAVYITPDEESVAVAGSAELFFARPSV